jgi:hypothetical protein
MLIFSVSLLAAGLIIINAYFELSDKTFKEAILVTSALVVILCVTVTAWIPAVVWLCVFGLEYKEYLEL